MATETLTTEGRSQTGDRPLGRLGQPRLGRSWMEVVGNQVVVSHIHSRDRRVLGPDCPVDNPTANGILIRVAEYRFVGGGIINGTVRSEDPAIPRMNVGYNNLIPYYLHPRPT